MGRQTIRDGKFVYYFDNLPDEIKLRFHNNKGTLSFIPSNFNIVNIDSFHQVVVEEKEDSKSLMV